MASPARRAPGSMAMWGVVAVAAACVGPGASRGANVHRVPWHSLETTIVAIGQLVDARSPAAPLAVHVLLPENSADVDESVFEALARRGYSGGHRWTGDVWNGWVVHRAMADPVSVACVTDTMRVVAAAMWLHDIPYTLEIGGGATLIVPRRAAGFVREILAPVLPAGAFLTTGSAVDPPTTGVPVRLDSPHGLAVEYCDCTWRVEARDGSGERREGRAVVHDGHIPVPGRPGDWMDLHVVLRSGVMLSGACVMDGASALTLHEWSAVTARVADARGDPVADARLHYGYFADLDLAKRPEGSVGEWERNVRIEQLVGVLAGARTGTDGVVAIDVPPIPAGVVFGVVATDADDRRQSAAGRLTATVQRLEFVLE